MPDHKDALMGMLQDIIHGREEQAAVTMHDYFVAKTREVAGLVPQESAVEPDAVVVDDETPTE